MNIGRFKAKIKKYALNAKYPLHSSNKEIDKLNLVTAIDSQAMRLDKLLGRKIINVDNNE